MKVIPVEDLFVAKWFTRSSEIYYMLNCHPLSIIHPLFFNFVSYGHLHSVLHHHVISEVK